MASKHSVGEVIPLRRIAAILVRMAALPSSMAVAITTEVRVMIPEVMVEVVIAVVETVAEVMVAEEEIDDDEFVA